jgi:hypothetical protein
MHPNLVAVASRTVAPVTTFLGDVIARWWPMHSIASTFADWGFVL